MLSQSRDPWRGGQVITTQPIAQLHKHREVDVRCQQMKANVFLADAHDGGWHDT
jgi:hypothetical protein